MDVIPDAGSVVGRIVPPEDLDARPPPQRYIEDQRNQMGLRFMRLAVALDRARHIKVAEARIFETMAKIHPSEHLFHQQLALAIGIGGLELRVFEDRRGLRLAVARRSR